MSNWSGLPPEILNHIFNHFEKKKKLKYLTPYASAQCDLAQCALTCRGWRISAQSKIFSNFTMKYDIEHLEKARHFISKNDTLGKWVKSLTLYFRETDTYDESILLATDKIFPLLEEIIFFNYSERTYEDPIFFSLYKAITEMGGFSHLKKLPRPWNEYQEDLYLKSLWFLKHRVTYVFLSERVSSNYHESFLEKLQYFPNLNEIEFDSSIDRSETEPQNVAKYIESLTKNSSLLKLSLSLYALSTVSLSTTKLKRISSSMSSLRELNVDIIIHENNVSIPNDEFILYIMKKAPNLISLQIQNQSDLAEEGAFSVAGNFDNSTLQSVNAITQFFNYIYRMPHCVLENVVVTSENISKVIQSIFASRTKTRSNTTRKILDDIDIRFHDTENLDEELENTDPLKAIIDYRASTYSERRTMEVIFNKYNVTYRQQLLELIEQAGQYFDRMSIHLALTCEAPSVIKRLARCCTKLTGLKISCQFYPFEEDLPDKEENDTTPTHNFNNNLQTLVFSGCVPPENQFRFILNHFPHLKTLIIKDFFSTAFDQQHVNPYFLFDMPNVSLKEFKIGLDTGFLDYMIINSIYIKLTASYDQNTRYYFFMINEKDKFCRFKLLEKPTESQYQEIIPTKDIFNFEIRCKSIETFNYGYNSMLDPWFS